MSIKNQKFLLILLILGIGVQTCTLHFPEAEAEAISSSSEEDSSSSQMEAARSSSAGYQYSSSLEFISSDSSISSSSFDDSPSPSSSSDEEPQLSSSSVASSSSRVSSSSRASSSSRTTSSSSRASSSSSSKNSSSSNSIPSSSSAIVYGSMTQGDQTYKTVVIGTQTWMAENLNYAPSGGKHKCYAQGKGNNEDSWLAPSDPQVKANCDKYGRLYDWATAKTVCPSGWHLPDTSDWGKLRRFIEKEIFDNWEDVDFGWDVGTKLKATTGWKESSISDKGVDSYGFGAIGTGYCVSCDALSDASGYYSGKEEEAHWWSGTEYVNQYTNDKTQAYKAKVTYNKKVMTLEFEKKADYLYSVRCIKN